MTATKKAISKSPSGEELELNEKDEQLANELGVDLSLDAKQLIANIIDKTNRSVSLIVEAGLELIALKSKCKHGEFEPILEAAGLSSQRASEMMRYGRFASSLPQAQRAKALTLPKKKVLLLASADADTVSELLNSEDELDDLTSLNPTQMRKRIKQLETNLDNSEMTTKALKKRILEKNSIGPYHEDVEMVRMESVAASSGVFLYMDDLTALIDEVASAGFLGKDHSDKDFSVAATTLYTNIHAIHARTSKLMSDCKEWLDEGITKGVKDIPVLSDKECVSALSNRELLVAEHTAQKLSRQKQRADKKKTSRGKASK